MTALASRLPGLGSLPPPLSDFLLEENSQAVARAHRLQETLGSVLLALRAAGVEVVALKGAALAFFHYEDPALRPMGDLDLLLRDPRDLARATTALSGAGWRALLDTPRHRVFARPDERVVRPAAEHPDNPIRVEVHTSFRLPVLGRVYDATTWLLRDAETRDLGGTDVSIAAGPALAQHLLFHAAEDFAGNGIRGIQAHDFRVLARGAFAPHGGSGAFAPPGGSGAFAPPGDSSKVNVRRLRVDLAVPPDGAAPLLYAADAVERLFPLTFEEILLERLSSSVDPGLRARAASLPPLRHTRPARGWTRTLLSLADGPAPRARFLLRTLFPTPGEVKANAAPDASGLALAAAYVRVLVRRVARALGGSA